MSQGCLQVAPLNCLSINGNASNKHCQHSMNPLSELTGLCPLHTHHCFIPVNLPRWGFWVWMCNPFYPIHQCKGTTLWPLMARYQFGSGPFSAKQWHWHGVWHGFEWMGWSAGLKFPAMHLIYLYQLVWCHYNVTAADVMKISGQQWPCGGSFLMTYKVNGIDKFCVATGMVQSGRLLSGENLDPY